MSPGRQARDYCAVQDVAEAIGRVIHRIPENPVEVFNIGSGLAVPLTDLVAEVCESIGLAVEVQAGALAYAPQESTHVVADTARARNALGWSASTDLVYAVWQLAGSAFPQLKVHCPR
jgi:nucleoside-diphosphate-sugar epimerase